MNPREKLLLVIFGGLVLTSLVAFGLSAYTDKINSLDEHYLELKKNWVQQRELAIQGKVSLYDPSLLKRFYFPGKLPPVLSLVQSVETAARDTGLILSQSKVSQQTPTETWLQVKAYGTINVWFAFLKEIRHIDSHVLMRTLTLDYDGKNGYQVYFEIGHRVEVSP